MTRAAVGTSRKSAQWAFGDRLLETCAMVGAFALAGSILVDQMDGTYRLGFSTAAIVLIVGWIVVQDLRTYTIADGAVASIAILAVAQRWSAGDHAVEIALDCLLTGGVLFAFREWYYRTRGFDGLGLGDVKLAAAGGILVGSVAFAWALLAASLLSLGGVAARRIHARRGRGGLPVEASDKLPFGAALAPAILVFWLAESLPNIPPFAGLQ